jgi:hypothetical protein
MSPRANVVNRVVLTVLGVLLVAAGGLGLALGAGAFGDWRSNEPVLPWEVATFPDEHPWFWWAVAAALLLVAVLAVLWLLIQLKTDRTTRLDRTTDAQDGYTRLHASALTDAVEDEALGVTGVTGASAALRERKGDRVFLRVDLADSANIAEVRTRLEDEVVAHLREAVGDPHFPVMIELRPASTTRQRSLI